LAFDCQAFYYSRAASKLPDAVKYETLLLILIIYSILSITQYSINQLIKPT